MLVLRQLFHKWLKHHPLPQLLPPPADPAPAAPATDASAPPTTPPASIFDNKLQNPRLDRYFPNRLRWGDRMKSVQPSPAAAGTLTASHNPNQTPDLATPSQLKLTQSLPPIKLTSPTTPHHSKPTDPTRLSNSKVSEAEDESEPFAIASSISGSGHDQTSSQSSEAEGPQDHILVTIKNQKSYPPAVHQISAETADMLPYWVKLAVIKVLQCPKHNRKTTQRPSSSDSRSGCVQTSRTPPACPSSSETRSVRFPPSG